MRGEQSRHTAAPPETVPVGRLRVWTTIQAAYEWDNVVIVGWGGQAILRDKPGVRHRRGTNLAFGDGHVERRRWQDGRTL